MSKKMKILAPVVSRYALIFQNPRCEFNTHPGTVGNPSTKPYSTIRTSSIGFIVSLQPVYSLSDHIQTLSVSFQCPALNSLDNPLLMTLRLDKQSVHM